MNVKMSDKGSVFVLGRHLCENFHLRGNVFLVSLPPAKFDKSLLLNQCNVDMVMKDDHCPNKIVKLKSTYTAQAPHQVPAFSEIKVSLAIIVVQNI